MLFSRSYAPIATQLEGCEKVYVASIGPKPALGLRIRGIEAVVSQNPIIDILTSNISFATPPSLKHRDIRLILPTHCSLLYVYDLIDILEHTR